MAARPGVSVQIIDDAPAPSAVIDAAAAYMAGLAGQGRPLLLVRSLGGFVAEYGQRDAAANSALYDAVDAFFREGGKRCHVARVAPADAVAATLDLDDDGAAPTLTVTAKGVGTYGNAITVAVDTDADGSVLTIADASGTLEVSPRLTKEGLLSHAFSYIDVTDADAAEGEPATAAATALASGDDGTAGGEIDSDWVAALDLFTADLGIGTVAAPGESGTTRHSALLAHAASHDRVAILDTSDATDAPTLKSAATALAADANRRWGGLWGPWLTLPPVEGGTGTRRAAASGTVAGQFSRVDAGRSPAGIQDGRARFATDVRFQLTEAEITDLSTAGVNAMQVLRGLVVNYGIRSLTSRTTDGLWAQLTTTAIVNEIRAKAEDIGENYLFQTISTGTLAAFGGDLSAMLLTYYSDGRLYGDTAADAYTVDVSDAVNTPESIAEGCLKAKIQAKTAPNAEQVSIDIVRVAIDADITQPATAAV